MLHTVTELKNVLGQGAKVDRFTIQLDAPAGDGSLTIGTDGPVLCKAATFPEKTIGACEVWVQGRMLNIPGNEAFPNTWDLTFYQTAGHDMRKMFIKWMSSIDSYKSNTHNCNPSMFMVDGKVQQLSCEGEVSAEYTFHNMYPSGISAVTTDGSQINTIQEFTVTFTYSDWE